MNIPGSKSSPNGHASPLKKAMSKNGADGRDWNGDHVLFSVNRELSLIHGNSQEIERGCSRSGPAGEAGKS